MEIRLISFSLPSNIKSLLGRMAFGLPETVWFDLQELHLPICQMELPNSSYDLDIIELLKTSLMTPFSITVTGPRILLPKSGKGQILMDIREKDFLNKTKSSLEKLLKSLPIRLKNTPEQLSIPLAVIEKISEQKLADWMENHALFQPIEFSPEEIRYEKPHLTDKSKFFLPIAKFPLQKLH